MTDPIQTCWGLSVLQMNFRGKNELAKPVICPSSLVTALSSLRSEQLLIVSFPRLRCRSGNSEERLDRITGEKERNCLLTCYTLDCFCRCLRAVTAVNLFCLVTHVERESLRNGQPKCLFSSQRSQMDDLKIRRWLFKIKDLGRGNSGICSFLSSFVFQTVTIVVCV